MVRDPSAIVMTRFFPCFILNIATLLVFFLELGDLPDRLGFVGMILVFYTWLLEKVRDQQPEISKMSLADKILCLYLLIALLPLSAVALRKDVVSDANDR